MASPSARALEKKALCQRVLEFRLAGVGVRTIAERMNLSLPKVTSILTTELARSGMECREDAHRLRELTMQRLEEQYAASYAIAMKGLGRMELADDEEAPDKVSVSLALERLRKLALDIAEIGGATQPGIVNNTQINVSGGSTLTFQQVVAEAQAQGMVTEPPRNPDVKVLEQITEENFPRGEEVDFSSRNADIQSTGELGETARTGDPYADHEPGLAEAIPDFFSALPERGASRSHLSPRRRVSAGPQDISTGR